MGQSELYVMAANRYLAVLFVSVVVTASDDLSFGLVQSDKTIRNVQNQRHCLEAYKDKKVRVHYNCHELGSLAESETPIRMQWQYVEFFGFIQSISTGLCWTVEYKTHHTRPVRGSKIFMRACDNNLPNQKFDFVRGELKLRGEPELCVTTRKPQSFLTINTCKASMFGQIV